MKPKDIFIWALAALCLVISLFGQPWAELGFGQDPNAITNRSMLSEPLHKLAEATEPLRSFAESMRVTIVGKMDKEAEENGSSPEPDWQKNWVKVGNYAYVWFMALAMVAAAIAIVMIGREDAEEKTVIPVKK